MLLGSYRQNLWAYIQFSFVFGLLRSNRQDIFAHSHTKHLGLHRQTRAVNTAEPASSVILDLDNELHRVQPDSKIIHTVFHSGHS